MRGVLLHYNYESHQGLIRAEDEKRYAFEAQQWRSEKRPSVGDNLDFEVRGQVAYDIYVLDLTSLPQTASSPAPSGMVRDVLEPGHSPFVSSIAIIASVTLLACFAPYISYGGLTPSLIEVGSYINKFNAAIKVGENFGRMFAPSQMQQPVNPLDTISLQWTIKIAYVLYVVPLMSIFAIAGVILRKGTRIIAFFHGVISIVVPIVVFVAIGLGISDQLPRELLQALKLDDVELDLGFFVIALSGSVQLLNWVRLILSDWIRRSRRKTLKI